MKMQEVCDVFAGAGMESVRSVLASGNIIFRSDIPEPDLRRTLETAMREHYSCDVSMFVKRGVDVARMRSSAPFAQNPEMHIYAFICQPSFERVLSEEFARIVPIDGEAGIESGGYFYWQVPKGATLDAGFSKILGRRDLKDKFTSRNIGTLQKICDKL
jgi:uncharacterized protein (DUF1697 family)